MGVLALSQSVLLKIQSQPALRYGDTSPWKCYLLHAENGCYTVVTENGDMIHDVAGWFVPWDAASNETEESRHADERKPDSGRKSC